MGGSFKESRKEYKNSGIKDWEKLIYSTVF